MRPTYQQLSCPFSMFLLSSSTGLLPVRRKPSVPGGSFRITQQYQKSIRNSDSILLPSSVPHLCARSATCVRICLIEIRLYHIPISLSPASHPTLQQVDVSSTVVPYNHVLHCVKILHTQNSPPISIPPSFQCHCHKLYNPQRHIRIF